ncbi:MAG: LemA family protein [Burkholderiaceae bacterium]
MIWTTRLASLSNRLSAWLAMGMLSLALAGCGYNDIQSADEATKSAWSEVVNQYQRRSDLIPNLVNTVKGYADQEKEVLVRVTEARSRVGQVRVDPTDEGSLRQFESAQREMGSALSRLLVVAENYPQLKSDQNFRDLQAQLEGTENRITVARKRYIEAIERHNVLVRQFPVNLTAMVFGYKAKPQFSVDNEREISVAPKVDFGSGSRSGSGAAPSGAAAPAAPATGASPRRD